jgi:hypothetical protein
MRQRMILTVARPTTADGETVQITANLKASLPAGHIADQIEAMSLAIQHRVAKQNEIVAETDAQVAHGKWLRITEKLERAEADGRRGMGVLTKAERAWWLAHRLDFDKDGPIVKPERVEQAARGESEVVEEG